MRLGHNPIPVALPGVDDGSHTAVLEDQVAAALAAVDESDNPMVVGHSAACTLAWIVADRRSDAIHSVVLIGGFPSASGERYTDFFETVDGVMPFPGWGPFDGPDSIDLDETTKERFEADALAVPGGVSRGTVRLTDERRYEIPVIMVCPEFSPDDAKEWIDGGEVPELPRSRDVSYIDIDSGHWPLLSKPAELTGILDTVAADR